MLYLGSTWEILETAWEALRATYEMLGLLDCLGLDLVGENRPCLQRSQLIFWDYCSIFQILLGNSWEIQVLGEHSEHALEKRFYVRTFLSFFPIFTENSTLDTSVSVPPSIPCAAMVDPFPHL